MLVAAATHCTLNPAHLDSFMLPHSPRSRPTGVLALAFSPGAGDHLVVVAGDERHSVRDSTGSLA